MNKHYRDPTPALKRSEPDLPWSEKILCAVIVTIVIVAVVWISVHVDHSRR